MRIAVISDIHSNLRALEAVLASIGTVDALWQLGDVVGYGPDPDAVVARLRQVGAIGVRGNHDAAAAGYVSTDDFNVDGRLALEWTRAQISPETSAYVAALPERRVPEGSDFTLVHGSPRDPIWEYLVDTWAARENLSAFATAFCLNGHTHVPLVLGERRGHVEAIAVASKSRIDLDSGRAFLNPGSVGQPRDGDPRASYMVIDTDARVVTWQRVSYDIEATQAAMLEAGLPHRLARRLSHGM
ncbi:MAG: metallophosphoesterase family protein [Candidatus Limnocylindrales bacterium]|jgi:predicted phosphodiesterase